MRPNPRIYFKSIGLKSHNYYLGICLFYFVIMLLPILITFMILSITCDSLYQTR